MRITDCEILNGIEFKQVKFNSNSTSNIYIDADKRYIIKQDNKIYASYNVMEREVCLYNILNVNGYDWCPKLIHTDNTTYIVVEYAGVNINAQNCPNNWEKQIDIILNDLKKETIKHNDIKLDEILVKDGKIYLVDYGWCSVGGEMSCGIGICNKKKPYMTFVDSDIKKKIRNIYRKKRK
jgi:tRNA A-37 threonylcarbamoyl transferase component Bud32